MALVYDTTPPEPPSIQAEVPLVHTGGPSAKHQTSACCMTVSWQAAIDAESAVRRYLLCFASSNGTYGVSASVAAERNDDQLCISVGNETAVNIANTLCECHFQAAGWPLYIHETPLAVNTSNSSVDGTAVISFVLVAENVLRMRYSYQASN